MTNACPLIVREIGALEAAAPASRQRAFLTCRAASAFPELGQGSQASKPLSCRRDANLKRKRKPQQPAVRQKTRASGQLPIRARNAIRGKLTLASQPMRRYNNASQPSRLRKTQIFDVRRNRASLNAPIPCNHRSVPRGARRTGNVIRNQARRAGIQAARRCRLGRDRTGGHRPDCRWINSGHMGLSAQRQRARRSARPYNPADRMHKRGAVRSRARTTLGSRTTDAHRKTRNRAPGQKAALHNRWFVRHLPPHAPSLVRSMTPRNPPLDINLMTRSGEPFVRNLTHHVPTHALSIAIPRVRAA